MTTALSIIVGIFLAVVTLTVAWAFYRGCRKMNSHGKIFSLFAVATLVSMGLKPVRNGYVRFPFTEVNKQYIFDNGSYVTNDFVHVDFIKAAFVPQSAPLYCSYRSTASTNDADFVELFRTTFADFSVPQDIPFKGAETNDFYFYTTWTPGPVAHTNGIAVVYWRQINRDIAAPIKTGIYTNAVRLAPSPAMTNITFYINLEEEVSDENNK